MGPTNTMKSLTAISLFSGCGGFDWGATSAGVSIVWANDIDKHAAAAYRSLFPCSDFVHADVCDISKFPSADILIGCYPCTGFSVAARRRWKDRLERDLLSISGNFLYREYLRALRQVLPKYFFVENVRGMVSAHDGWFFKEQIRGFEDLGYTVYHKLLSAQDYGVPQSRQRVFIVGVRDDVSRDFNYEYAEPTHRNGSECSFRTLREAIGDMPLWPTGDFLERAYHGHYLTRNRKRGWDQPSYTVVANASHVPLHPEGEPMVFVEKDKWALCGDFNRRLSWRECARIQGLPDHINPGGELEDKYRVVGNAVPPAFGRILLEPVVQHEAA